MPKSSGIRGSGRSAVRWRKSWDEPLGREENAVLARLVRIRQNMAQGKGSPDKHYEWQIDQEHQRENLYELGIDTDDWYCPCQVHGH